MFVVFASTNDQAGRLDRCRQRGRHDGTGLGAAGSTRHRRRPPRPLRRIRSRSGRSSNACGRSSKRFATRTAHGSQRSRPGSGAPLRRTRQRHRLVRLRPPARLPRPVRRLLRSPARLRRRGASALQPQERRPACPVRSPRLRHLHRRPGGGTVDVPSGAAGAGGPQGRCRSTATAPHCRRSSTPTWR